MISIGATVDALFPAEVSVVSYSKDEDDNPGLDAESEPFGKRS